MDSREVIRLNSSFLEQKVQPLLDQKNIAYFSAKAQPDHWPFLLMCLRTFVDARHSQTELIKGLVELLKEKIRKDIDKIFAYVILPTGSAM